MKTNLGKEMKKIFGRPEALTDFPYPYCTGCGHGIVQRLVGEAMDDLGIVGRAIGVTSAGCSVRNWKQFACDMTMGLHGRGPAVATGLKRSSPDNIIFTYQGDGDLAAIGTGEIVHAASRCERITTIYVNNAVFGATGGQQAPTTLLGQKTTSFPGGRDPRTGGYPLKMAEMLAGISPEAYIVRVSIHDVKHILQAGKAIRRAFEVQIQNQGFSLVEILSMCPTQWKVTPVQALQWIPEKMIPYYPLGEFAVPKGN
jgi:2-oxoglutarate/2-oxoacid ferredoxin oxidoreductase subunit beta